MAHANNGENQEREFTQMIDIPTDEQISDMNGPALIALYNSLIEGTAAKPVKKFESRKAGIARVLSLASAARAEQEAAKPVVVIVETPKAPEPVGDAEEKPAIVKAKRGPQPKQAIVKHAKNGVSVGLDSDKAPRVKRGTTEKAESIAAMVQRLIREGLDNAAIHASVATTKDIGKLKKWRVADVAWHRSTMRRKGVDMGRGA